MSADQPNKQQQQKPKTAISPTRAEDYAEWYQQVVRAADLAKEARALSREEELRRERRRTRIAGIQTIPWI